MEKILINKNCGDFMYRILIIMLLSVTFNLNLIYSQTVHKSELNKEEDPQFRKEREKWLEDMHKAEPGVDYKAINKELKQFLRDEKNKKRQELLLSGKLPTEKLQSSVLAGGRVIGDWIERGSNNQAGRIHQADIDLKNNVLYAASSGGNVWRATVDGKNWTCLNNSFQFESIGDFKVKNLNSFTRLYVFDSKKLFFTDNDGATWNNCKGLESLEGWGWIMRGVIMESNSQPLIYALTEEWNYNTSKVIKKLYVSNDAGLNFKAIKDFGTVKYIEMWGADTGNDNLYILKDDSLFTVNPNGVINLLSVSDDMKSITDRKDVKMTGAVFSDTTKIYFALQMGYEDKRYIFKFDDKSNKITYVGETPTNMFMRNSFCVSKINPEKLFIGGVNAYISNNSGLTWVMINRWDNYYQDPENKLHADIPGITSIKTSNTNEIILIGTDGGLYKTIDNKYTFKNIGMKGLNVSQYYSIYTHNGSLGEYIFAGAQDQGFQVGRISGEGVLDFEQNISGDYGCITSGDGGNSIWTVYPGFAMIYSKMPLKKDGATWDFSSISGDRVWMPPITAIPGNPYSAYIACGGSVQSSSNIWRLDYDDIQITAKEYDYRFDSAEPDNNVTALGISSIDTNYIYALTQKGKFYTSTDAGITWTVTPEFIGPGYNYLHPTAIHASKTSLGTVFICGSGYSNSGVYMTSDNGKTFKALNNQLPKTMVYDVTSTPDDEVLFAATQVGPYLYIKNNDKWFPISGFETPEQTFWSVNYIPETKTARFATYGRGIWDFKISQLLTTDVEEKSVNQEPLVTISPNPASDKVTIEIKGNAGKNITAKIYNIEGNQVYDLYSGKMSSDLIQFNWDLTNYASHRVVSGTYLLIYVVDGINNYAKIKVVK